MREQTRSMDAKFRLVTSIGECMKQYPLEDITVDQVARGAGLSRQTFYRHFRDKYDLINWYFDKLLLESFDEMGSGRTVREGLDRNAVEASLNRAVYALREEDEPQGIGRCIRCVGNWLYGEDPTDALETLYELYDRTGTLARKKGVTLTLDVPEALPPVLTNEDRLQQVLTILLDNAIKFTPAGGTVTLLARQEGRHVRFAVRDTGIGMDEHTLQHAFDRFHQADPSHNLKGSGLGLAIAQEIMQRLDSRVTAKSQPGKGSEFAFLIRTAAGD